MPLWNYSYESLTIQKPPDFFFFLPKIPPPFETVTAKVNRAARLTDDEGGPVKGGVSFGRSWRSRRGTTRRRWWPESVGPRAQAGRLKSGDVDPVAPVRYSLIPGSRSFTEARRGYPEGRTVRGMARVAALRWSGLERPLAHRAKSDRRWSCAPARLRASGGVRSRPRSAL
jgi:hypothetical protein